MIPQTFSLEMCRLLSSLAPEFEGHSVYVHGLGRNGKERINVVCRVGELQWLGYAEKDIICPAWQVEDVLRNAHKLFGDKEMVVCKKIAWFFVAYQDIVYQKIEEYLWSVLK